MKFLRLLLFVTAAGAGLAQNPAITAVQNSASNVPAGLPNAAIAQGSLFVVYGSNLGPASIVIADKFPLQTTLGGTSVQVTVAGKTVSAIMYYSLATQVAAILPSSTPTGTGTVTVTFNGRTSATAPVTVVQNNIGIFTVSQTGSGDAIATIGNSYATPSNAANPGEVVAFWGTGLGPVTFDESNAAQQSDMTNVPVEAYVAGKQANIAFRGRNACCTAVDTVYITIPAGVSGCATPVVFKIGNIVSNTTTVPVAASGRTCTPTNPGVASSDLAKWFSQGTFTGGGVSLSRFSSTTQPITVGGVTVPGSTSKGDSGGASFYKVTVLPGAIGLSSAFDIASFGSCSVSSFSGQGSTPRAFAFTSLDAGASIGVSGPGGSKTLTKSTAAGLIGYSASFDNTASYLNAGNYTITGPGGPDVGSFTANLTLPAPLVWTNQSSITAVDRSKGVTVTWSGGDQGGYVQITGSSFISTGGSSAVSTTFTCTAKTSDGTFTVPSIVLLALPPSGSISSGGISVALPGSLSVSGVSAISSFKASGLDFGSVTSLVSTSSSVTYQ
jgi:uncharacterized protein (TIGR03437 family)